MRLRKNCTEQIEYKRQAEITSDCFVQKEYEKTLIEGKIKEVGNMDRHVLIKDRIKTQEGG